MRPSSGGRRLTAAALEGQACAIERERQVTRKELAAAARDAMKGLLMRPALRLVLAELVGCWGEKMLGDRILVHPSNEYLVRRTGLGERSVRYGIRGLVELGVMTPKDSANGKRFAIKNRAGMLIDIFGFDLTPLYARRAEFIGLISAQDAENERRARLFDEITIHRRAIEEALGALPDESKLLSQLDDLRDRTPRRSLTTHEATLHPIVNSWRALRGAAEEAFYSAASGGKSRRHIESKPSESKNSYLEQEAFQEGDRGENHAPIAGTADVALVLEACPSLSEYVELPKSEVDLVATARYLRGSLGASQSVWDEAVEKLGPINAAAAVCLVLQLHADDRGSRIRNPGGYLRAMVRMFAEGKSNVRYELMALIRRKKPGG
jgi:replication initiation protein RepC